MLQGPMQLGQFIHVINDQCIRINQFCSAFQSKFHPHIQAFREQDIVRVADRDVIRFFKGECLFNAKIDRRARAGVFLAENLQIRVELAKTFQYFRGGIGTFIIDNDVEIILVGLLLDPVDGLQQKRQSTIFFSAVCRGKHKNF